MKPTKEEIDKAAMKYALDKWDPNRPCGRLEDFTAGALAFTGLNWKRPEEEMPDLFVTVIVCFRNEGGRPESMSGFLGDTRWHVHDDGVQFDKIQILAWAYIDLPEWAK